MPGPNDWELTIRTKERVRLRPGRHELLAHTADGHEVQGWAVMRFSQTRNQHLFHGDGDLARRPSWASWSAPAVR